MLTDKLKFKKALLSCCSVIFILSLTGCSKEATTNNTITPIVVSVANVDVSSVQQLIDGIGGSTAWSGSLSQGEMNSLFGNDNNQQLGLSIIRVRIDPKGNWGDEKANAQKAKALGATVFATPWTPPATMKDNSNEIGGQLNTTEYANYATWLKSFCTYMGNVDAISIQNEPNITVTYESCTWNATQLLNFVKNNASAIGKPIVMPEAYNFSFALSDATLNDTAAASQVTFVAGHLYGTTVKKYSNALSKGKRTWMTEHYYDANDLPTCLTVAKEIHDCMVIANHSAYIWWYLKTPGCNVISNGVINKKGYIIGQFSKFVRPGYNRVDVTFSPTPNTYVSSNIYVSAYKSDNKVVVVAINMGTSSYSQPFAIQNRNVTSVTPYVTSATQDMLTGSVITTTGNSFTATLPAQSVTTFVAE